jgi:hypothetical protein
MRFRPRKHIGLLSVIIFAVLASIYASSYWMYLGVESNRGNDHISFSVARGCVNFDCCFLPHSTFWIEHVLPNRKIDFRVPRPNYWDLPQYAVIYDLYPGSTASPTKPPWNWQQRVGGIEISALQIINDAYLLVGSRPIVGKWRSLVIYNETNAAWGSVSSFPIAHYTQIMFPLWPVILISGMLTFGFVRSAWRHRFRRGHCRRCGYDLRASPQRCPECGTSVQARDYLARL